MVTPSYEGLNVEHLFQIWVFSYEAPFNGLQLELQILITRSGHVVRS